MEKPWAGRPAVAGHTTAGARTKCVLMSPIVGVPETGRRHDVMRHCNTTYRQCLVTRLKCKLHQHCGLKTKIAIFSSRLCSSFIQSMVLDNSFRSNSDTLTFFVSMYLTGLMDWRNEEFFSKTLILVFEVIMQLYLYTHICYFTFPTFFAQCAMS